jgi:hypothetical protein
LVAGSSPARPTEKWLADGGSYVLASFSGALVAASTVMR